ncbi:MAG: hypothetical protein J7515_17395 [Caulobacter sp.]|nr:hypothetical protein [Caulobacter sp.]
MFKITASAVLAASLVAAPAAMAADKPQQMGWLAQTIRSVVVFHGCTQRLKEKFNIGPLNDIDVTNMDAEGDSPPSGAMDVKFEATTTEKKTGRKSHFIGVCHIDAEGGTRIDAHLVGQSGGPIRRVPPGKITG